MFDINDFLKIGLAQRIHNGISGFFCGFQHKQITSGIYSLGNGGTTQVYYSKVALNGAIFLWVIEWTNGMYQFFITNTEC